MGRINNMKFLVTGGAGFIGGNFVHYMVNKYPDDMIVNLDKLTYAGNLETCKPVEDKPNYKFVKGDIADREFIFDLFEKEKFDVVVNFAAESHVDRSIEDPEIFVKTNVMGTTTLLDACVKYGIKRYHQVSTDEVYGDLPLDRPDLFFTEETPLHTSSPYSSAKASADLFVLAYHRTYGLPVTISRCSNTLFSLINLAIVSFTLFIALNTLFPRYRASSLSRNSKASYFPVEAPLGTIALPENPLSVVTST